MDKTVFRNYISERANWVFGYLNYNDLEAIPLIFVAFSDTKRDILYHMYETRVYKNPSKKDLKKIGEGLTAAGNWKVACIILISHTVDALQKVGGAVNLTGLSVDGEVASVDIPLRKDDKGYLRSNAKKNAFYVKNEKKIKKSFQMRYVKGVFDSYKKKKK